MLQKHDKLLIALHENALVITPNNRLSKQLINLYADKYLNSTTSIAKPLCLPYQAFLQYLYKEVQHRHPHIEHPILLNNWQESYIWQNILKNSTLENTNTNLLNQLQEAWNICRLWQVDINHPDFTQTWQCTISKDLQIQFKNYLKKTNTITQANLVNYIIKYPTINHKKIIWACFDDFNPAQNILKDYLQNHQNSICYYEIEPIFADSYKYQAQTPNDEYSAMLNWLETRLATEDSNIAIVMPNIEEDGNRVANLIKNKFPNELINISLGRKLSEYLLVAHALRFLMLENTITNCDARLILNSPYLSGSQSEFIKRAELFQNLKIFKQHTLKIEDLAEACKNITPILTNILNNLSTYPEHATPAEWAYIFQERLNALGFPGEYSLSSNTYQCLTRLQNLFKEFVKIAVLATKLNKHEALDALCLLANSSIFQPKQEQSKISVLGLLEASGCIFDSIWVTNLTDKCLPKDTNFSPFIPISLQKSLTMPRSANIKELQFAKQQLTRLKASCKNIVYSYPSFVDDIPMLPSPLLENIQLMPTINTWSKSKETKLVSFTEDYLIPLENIDEVRGGTALLANQAKCPFMAFAKNRLFTETTQQVDNWPNNLERGQILHKILEEFWNEIKDKRKLMSTSDAEINKLINKISTKIIKENQPPINTHLHNLIINGEINRYNKLIKAAIEWELSRPNFEIVDLEKTYNFNIDGINFNIRVDRLDADCKENLSKIIIDYKSSLPSTKPWDEDRPLEPQLLLYALLDNTVNCILYLELKNGKVYASGVSSNDGNIPGIKPIENWQNAKQKWQMQLSSLVQEFKQGLCIPNPAKSSICQNCDLQKLCRT